jgi:hypothetical protein
MQSVIKAFAQAAFACLACFAVLTGTVYAQKDETNQLKDFERFIVYKKTPDNSSFTLFNDLFGRTEGKGYALVAGISNYRYLGLLTPAAEDMRKMINYLKTYENIDEIVFLHDDQVTESNLSYAPYYNPSRYV